MLFETVAPFSIARNLADSEGKVKTFQLCVIDRGPFWIYGKSPVYYVSFEDGRNAYIVVTIFGAEIEYK